MSTGTHTGCVDIAGPQSPTAETIGTAPKKVAASLRDLTTSALTPAKTREVSMATPQDKPLLRPDDPRHSTWAGYGAGCRLDCCRKAARQYQKLRLHERNHGGRRLVDAAPAKRRLEALAAIGWDFYSIATEMGQHREWIWQMYRRDTINAKTAEKIADAYERICMVRPEGWVADRARRSAAAKGWLPPLAWDDIEDGTTPTEVIHIDSHDIDEVKVDRVLSGVPVYCTRAERVEVIGRWPGSLAELERLTGWNVHRYINGEAA